MLIPWWRMSSQIYTAWRGRQGASTTSASEQSHSILMHKNSTSLVHSTLHIWGIVVSIIYVCMYTFVCEAITHEHMSTYCTRGEEHHPSPFSLTHPPLERVPLLQSHCVCLGNNWDYVDTVVQPLHELNVQGLQTRDRGSKRGRRRGRGGGVEREGWKGGTGGGGGGGGGGEGEGRAGSNHHTRVSVRIQSRPTDVVFGMAC